MIRYLRQRVRDVRAAPAIVLVGLVLRAAATGLLAMGVTGIVFMGIRYRLGDAALAADADRAPLSAERCEDLLAQYPEQPDCYSAETAHHADEALQVRFGAAALGVLALAAFGVIAWRSGAWRRRSRALDPPALAALAALFGLVAVVGLGLGFDELRRGADDPPRWFADGGVALVFFCGLLVLLRRRSSAVESV